MQDFTRYLENLKKSKFRLKFKLKEKDLSYINEKGLDTIEKHARDFIEKRLAPCNLPNDGKQTPFKGHPIFVAQHATATCCRICLCRWYKINPNKPLSKEEVDFVVNIIMFWIENQIKINIQN